MEDTASCIQNVQSLLQDDPSLQPLTHATTDAVVVPYAASLLPFSSSSSKDVNYTLLIQDVERKLTIIDSYMNKLSRTSPEAVTQQLLALHSNHGTGSTTLAALQERSLRLERQTEGLVATAVRVESVLQKSYTTLENATTQLERILDIHATLKFLLSWQFERHKVTSVYDIDDWPRDVIRMAQSLQRMDEWATAFFAAHPEAGVQHPIALWEEAQPQVQAVAAQLRRTAQERLQALLPVASGSDEPTAPEQPFHHQVYEWNAVLQVFFHLQELPNCVYIILEHWHGQALSATRWTTSPIAIDAWTRHLETALAHLHMLDRIVQHKSHPTRPSYAAVLAQHPLPAVYAHLATTKEAPSLPRLFWGRYCQALAQRIEELLRKPKEEKILVPLYPAIHMASYTILQQFHTVGGGPEEPPGTWSSSTPTGILGGTTMEEEDPVANGDPVQSPLSWTLPSSRSSTNQATTFYATVAQTPEWKLWHGDRGISADAATGLVPLRRAFCRACLDRLMMPLQYMFQENVTMNEDGVAISSGMIMLPTKYDLQRLEDIIRQELSVVVKHFGGSTEGRTFLLQLIAQCVVDMVTEFCDRAKLALPGMVPGGHDTAGSWIQLKQGEWSRTEALKHNCQVVTILYALHHSLQLLPETTYVQPFRPTVLAHHTQASQVCTEHLQPALIRIDDTIQQNVLRPLCKAIYRQMAPVWTKIHSGIYLDTPNAPAGKWEDDDLSTPSFVQKDVVSILDRLVQHFWAHFPPIYAGRMAAHITTYMIYSYVSHVSLLRPLTESVRLHITQDLADLEMALEQFLSKSGSGNLTLSHVDQGKPYAELRAVRQMLFWTGLDTKSKPAPDVLKSLWNEIWVKDVRSSTLFHYLFSFGPSTLSTPYHMKRISASEYVQLLVPHDPVGYIQPTSPGEEMAYSTIRACCDSYIQRASLPTTGASDGDPRIAQLVMLLGPELLRRRGRH